MNKQTIHFITGRKQKVSEAKKIIPRLEQLDIELDEIQSLDPILIIRRKLKEALKHKKGAFIVEDTGLYLDCMDGRPGPLIKWFIQNVGDDKMLARIALQSGNTMATAKTVIGYANSKGEMHFFKGEVRGQILTPTMKSKFGWDAIFAPDGQPGRRVKTFAHMSPEEKKAISMRAIAFRKLKDHLDKEI